VDLRVSPRRANVDLPDVAAATLVDTRRMSTPTHHHNGTPAEWLEDAAFLGLFFAAAAIVATIVVLLIVL
jgi:hypothetical protein